MTSTALLHTEDKFSIVVRLAPKQELQNNHIGELWKRYKPLEGGDDHADLVLGLIRKLILQGARDVAYGSWREKLSHPLRTYGISEDEWDF